MSWLTLSRRSRSTVEWRAFLLPPSPPLFPSPFPAPALPPPPAPLPAPVSLVFWLERLALPPVVLVAAVLPVFFLVMVLFFEKKEVEV
jgi:hypothetical protein